MQAIFETRTDNNGNTGLIFRGAPSHFDTVSLTGYKGQRFNPANLLTHDLLEHNFKQDNGSAEHELMALGAAMFGRGNHGDVTIDGLVGDLMNVARESGMNIKPTKQGIKSFEPIEWQIEEIQASGIINSMYREFDEDYSIEDIKAFLLNAYRYIRQGARKANKRFKNSFNMYSMFYGLSSEIMNKGKYIEEDELLIVNFSFKNLSYKVSILNPFESENY